MHTSWSVNDTTVPTIAVVVMGTCALMANAMAEAVDDSNATVSA